MTPVDGETYRDIYERFVRGYEAFRLVAPCDAADDFFVFTPTSTTDQEGPVSTPNPHDRRNRVSHAEATSNPLAVAGRFVPEPDARTVGLSVDDLDVLVRGKEVKAFERGAQSTAEAHAEEIANAKFRAWEAGHAAGVRDGARAARKAALQPIERNPKLLEYLRGVLAKAGPGDADVAAGKHDLKRLTKEELYRALDSAYDLAIQFVEELETRDGPTALEQVGEQFRRNISGFATRPSTASSHVRLVPGEPSRI